MWFSTQGAGCCFIGQEMLICLWRWIVNKGVWFATSVAILESWDLIARLQHQIFRGFVRQNWLGSGYPEVKSQSLSLRCSVQLILSGSLPTAHGKARRGVIQAFSFSRYFLNKPEWCFDSGEESWSDGLAKVRDGSSNVILITALLLLNPVKRSTSWEGTVRFPS